MPHADPVLRAAYQKAYRDNNREKIRGQLKAYRTRFADKVKAMKHDEYIKHRESYLARERQRRAVHKDEMNARRRTPEYRAKKNERRKQWWKSRGVWERKYYSGLAQCYSREHASLGPQKEVKEWYRNSFSSEQVNCEYCACAISSVRAFVDHKQPYRFGGKHEASNLAVCCSDCNLMKGASPWEVWEAFIEKRKGVKWQ